MNDQPEQKAKVIGVGLNKTGTKTLMHCFKQWGYRHQTYDLNAFQLYRNNDWTALRAWMDDFDSFEDWPWPLFYTRIDEWYPDAKFILTTRSSPTVWYRSLCKMAVRMGPLSDFERHIYGYSMPHGRKGQHEAFYQQHNQEVLAYFRDRPGKLLTVCWETEEGVADLPEFLGQTPLVATPPNLNTSLPVYGGDNLFRAHVSRVIFQTKWRLRALKAKIGKRLFR